MKAYDCKIWETSGQTTLTQMGSIQHCPNCLAICMPADADSDGCAMLSIFVVLYFSTEYRSVCFTTQKVILREVFGKERTKGIFFHLEWQLNTELLRLYFIICLPGKSRHHMQIAHSTCSIQIYSDVCQPHNLKL